MYHISLFSGIGGFDLAAQWAGWTNIVSCEINQFGRKHLEYYWPEAYHHDDIHTLTYEVINEKLKQRFGADWRTDDIVLTGGFPCQPYSLAGKRLGKEDDRHLWPEMLRVIREVKPDWIVGENVFGLVNWSDGLVFNEVQADLEAEGYEVQSFVLPACATDAPHRRDRLWIVAKLAENTMRGGCLCRKPNEEGAENGEQRNACSGNCNRVCLSERIVTNANSKRYEECDTSGEPGEQKRQYCEKNPKFRVTYWENFPTEPPVHFGNDGIPARLDGITFPKWRNESIKAAGNAVVPQVVLKIFEAINTIQTIHNTNTHNR